MKTEQTTDIKVIEYTHEYAQAVADMWNKSMDGWGGANTVMTAGQIRDQEENSSDMHTFLALDGDQVVGYCSMSEYREDRGALYIPLLNVRSDYRGKKVGKILVLNAVQKTVDYDWPRLDLYTWPGNTKAIPLYKKCGFFWEDRDDTTHLMNFIPSALNTEAAADFFKEADWYAASTRQIEVVPDGIKGDHHSYYEYRWEHDGRHLRMQYEQKGRGLRLIETDEYAIEMTLGSFSHVFGAAYPVHFTIKNKLSVPLELAFKGLDNESIQFDFSQKVTVENEKTVTGEFFVSPSAEKPDKMATHPVVETEIGINGKKALFKTGLKPEAPASMVLTLPGGVQKTGKVKTAYLDIENHHSVPCSFSFEWPENDLLEFDKDSVKVELDSGEKKSLPFEVRIKATGFFKPEMEVTADTDDNRTAFPAGLTVPVKGFGSVFGGESEKYYELYNGRYHLWLKKSDNDLLSGEHLYENHTLVVGYPKLGKPYSDEFSKQKPEHVELITDSGRAVMKVHYRSKAFGGLELIAVNELFSEGLFSRHYEIINHGGNETKEDLLLNESIAFNLDRAVLPYDEKIIELDGSAGGTAVFWDSSRFHENWLFSNNRQRKIGFRWDQTFKFYTSDWMLSAVTDVGAIEPCGKAQTGLMEYSIGAYDSWQAWRAYVQDEELTRQPLAVPFLEMEINGGNPVVDGQLTLSLEEHRKTSFDGEVTFEAGEDKKDFSFNKDDQKAGAAAVFDLEGPGVEMVRTGYRLGALQGQTEAAVLKPDNSKQVEINESKREGQEVLTLDNGSIQASASLDFFPAIYSVKYKNEEWLASTFPKLAPRAWWNPFPGGISGNFERVSFGTIAKQKTSWNKINRQDIHGNSWAGIRLTVEFTDHEQYKGLCYHQDYLMLPGVPVLVQATEIEQNSGAWIHCPNWVNGASLYNSEDGFALAELKSGGHKKMYTQRDETEFYTEGLTAFGYDSREDLLHVISDCQYYQQGGYLNPEVFLHFNETRLNAADGSLIRMKPVIYAFSDRFIGSREAAHLMRLEFK